MHPHLQPVIGDIVHFVYSQRDWAAIVTHVWSDDRVNLYVFPDASHSFGSNQVVASVFYNGLDHWDNTWHWPEQPVDDGDGAMPVTELSEING